MEEALKQQMFWLVVLTGLDIAGIGFAITGMIKKQSSYIKRGLLTVMFSGLAGVPYYYSGREVITVLQSENRPTVLHNFELDFYTVLAVTFFFSFSALAIYLIQKSAGKIPKFILVSFITFGAVVTVFLGWTLLT